MSVNCNYIADSLDCICTSVLNGYNSVVDFQYFGELLCILDLLWIWLTLHGR